MTTSSTGEPVPAAPMAARARLPWQVAFVILAGIWGCSFFFIKVGLEGLNPIQAAFGRCLIGRLPAAC
jgi:drug/metabolite transporter (DMT)-like permease